MGYPPMLDSPEGPGGPTIPRFNAITLLGKGVIFAVMLFASLTRTAMFGMITPQRCRQNALRTTGK